MPRYRISGGYSKNDVPKVSITSIEGNPVMTIHDDILTNSLKSNVLMNSHAYLIVIFMRFGARI